MDVSDKNYQECWSATIPRPLIRFPDLEIDGTGEDQRLRNEFVLSRSKFLRRSRQHSVKLRAECPNRSLSDIFDVSELPKSRTEYSQTVWASHIVVRRLTGSQTLIFVRAAGRIEIFQTWSRQSKIGACLTFLMYLNSLNLAQNILEPSELLTLWYAVWQAPRIKSDWILA